MKQKHRTEGQSGFWVKLIGVLVAAGIVVALVFSGIQNVMSQMAGLQRQLDTKSIAFDIASGQLADANRELGTVSSELETTLVELDIKTIELEQAHSESTDKSVELEDTRSRLEANVVQLSETENELNSTQSKFLAMAEELANVKSDLVGLSAELAETASILVERDQALSVKGDALAEAESELSAVKNELDATAIQLEQLQSQIETKDYQLAVLSEELSIARVDLSTTRGELTSKALELTQAQDDISEKAAKLVAWRSRYYMKSGELTQAQHEITEKAAELAALRSKYLKKSSELRIKSSELRTTHIKLANTSREWEEMRAVVGAASQTTMSELIGLLPDSFLTGEEVWTSDISRGKDGGVEDVLGIPNSAAGKQVYYRTENGGRMRLTFGVFASQDDAEAHYRRNLGLHSVLFKVESAEDFPKPNGFGSSLYGAVSIFQIDEYFIEIFLEIWTRGDPLAPLSRETLRFFENNRSAFEAPSSALGITQQELEAQTRELETSTGQLAKTKTELEVAYIMSAESQTELVAYLAAVELFNCYVHEIVGLVNHVLDDERSFSTEQRNLYRRHVDFLLDGSENANPIQDFCSNFSTDWAALLSEEAGKRASNRVQSELDLSSVDVTRMGNSFFEKGLGTPERIGERTAELAVDVYAKADEILLRMLGSNAFDLLAEALAGYRTTQ